MRSGRSFNFRAALSSTALMGVLALSSSTLADTVATSPIGLAGGPACLISMADESGKCDRACLRQCGTAEICKQLCCGRGDDD